jgi:hypothetical protein
MTYEDNLRHVAEPAAPSGRKRAVSATVPDYEALWMAEALREYAHYGDHPTESHQDIAIAYVEYIDRQVRDNERRHVSVYAHTDVAADTLMGALFHADGDESLVESVSTALAELYVAHADGDAPESPAAVSEHETVEFEDGAAGEAIAEAEMARAESEALAKKERAVERAMEEGRI